MSFVFFYSDCSPVFLGDRVLVTQNRMATVTAILLPGSEETLKWNVTEGGVILCFDDKDCWLVSDFHEDFELISRVSLPCPTMPLSNDCPGGLPVQPVSPSLKTPDSNPNSGEKTEPSYIDINESSDNSARKD